MPCSQSYRNTVQSVPVKYDVNCGYFVALFIRWKEIFSLPSLLRVAVFKSCMGVEFCQMRVFCINWDNRTAFLL